MSNFQGTDQKQIVVFSLDESRYALFLSAVERVIRAVEITPLPKAPEIVLGVINFHGQIIPVVDIRPCFHLPAREMSIDDRFIIARTSRRLVALVVNSIADVRELTDREMVTVEQVLPGAEYIRGVAKLEDNLVLICDLDQFLSFDEEQVLNAALARRLPKSSLARPGQARLRKSGTETQNEGQPPR
jgi:purine-binding chemotaxis protein CheW